MTGLKDALVGLAVGINEIVSAAVGGLLDFIDGRKVVRRSLVIINVWLLVDAYLWAKDFAETGVHTGVELGLIIGAVLVPITSLQGFMYKTYDSSRKTVDGK